jgi:rod shape-determining protein MreC
MKSSTNIPEAYSTYLGLTKETWLQGKREPFPSITARVVGKDPSYWFQTVIVDRGENDGIVEGMVAQDRERSCRPDYPGIV